VNHRKPTLFFIVFFLIVLPPLTALEKIPIAIMDFKVTNVEKSESDLFLDFFSNALFETGVFDVLQRDKRDKLMQEIQFSMSDTADAKKTRQVGKLLSSKLLVFGNLGKVGNNVLLSVSMVDVETGRTVSTYSKTYKSLEAVFDGLPDVSAALADPAAQSVFMKMTSVLYFDDFEQQKWTVSDKLFYQNGKYHILAKDSAWYTWENMNIDDYSIECEVSSEKAPPNAGYGIIFRLQDSNNFYLFEITASGSCDMVRYLKGEPTCLLPPFRHQSVNAKGMNLLKVTAFRNRYSLYINNVKVKDVTDSSFREGGFGLFASQGVDAAFDNLIVYQGNLVFYDYFSKPSENFVEDKVAHTQDGVYYIDGKKCTGEYDSWITEPRRNFSFKADMEFREGDKDAGYGLLFRMLDVENNYTFYISSSGYYRLVYIKNNVLTVLIDWKKSRLINAAGRNMIRVECIDDAFYLYINENLVETVNDTTFKEGGIGFAVMPGVNVTVDNAELFVLE
jgi:TolB-like protein